MGGATSEKSMANSKILTEIVSNLASLGARRLAIMGIVGVAVLASIGAAAYFLGRPAMQPIYTGLSAQDVSRITAVLSEEGLTFDVNEQRSAVLVPIAQTTRARSLLAQRGLPSSARAGYELFDQMGSIGLTSFMQEVTRVRALEGEIARTIQALDGVVAARVHLVLPDPGSFRRDRRDPSSSVLLRLDQRWTAASAKAVRHLVAAAVPGMKIEHVSVASSDGRVLAAGGDDRELGNLKLSEMEVAMATDLEQRASRTLASALGDGNYHISAAVRLDIDRQQINETVFDPKSRVERSIRTVKQSGSSEDANGKANVGVEANLPAAENGQSEGDKRRQREDKREELVNYELNTKSMQTVREGYRVQQLTIATVVNRKQIVAQLGGNASKEAVDARIEELQKLIAAATGARTDQNDRLEISAIDFPDNANAMAPVQLGFVDHLLMNVGTGINAAALLAAIALVLFLGVRPLSRVIMEPGKLTTSDAAIAGPAMGLGLPSPDGSMQFGNGFAAAEGFGSADTAGGGLSSVTAALDVNRERLAALIENDRERVAKVLKSWMTEQKDA